MSKEGKSRTSGEDEHSHSSDVDEEVLTLHRLDTLPRFSSDRQRYHKEDSRYTIDDEFEGEGDEEAFLNDNDLEVMAALRANRAANEAQAIDKTGRPEWLKESIRAAQGSRKVRLCLGLGLIAFLVIIFSFAFGSSEEGDGKLHRVYSWAGSIWHGDGTNSAAQNNYSFPIDIGFPGPTQMGKAPSLANEDKWTGEPSRGNSPIETTVPEVHGFELFKHMGPMSPYYSAPDFSVNTQKFRALPSSCQVDRVHILSRHGSRYPTSSSPANLIRKLFRDMKSSIKFTGPLDFLNSYDPDRLGLELLVPLGRQQLFESGVQHDMEYGTLIDADLKQFGKIFARAGSQQRIVDSGIAFLQGMFADKWKEKANFEVQIEAAGFNTTLAPNFACPRAGQAETEPGLEWGREWYNEYLKGAVQRYSQYVSGFQLDAQLLNAMQQLCSYDTVAFGRSDFCPLFTTQEWLDYEYYWDLIFYGSYGAGSEVGKAQGVGWVNEFMARLTQTKWNESTITSENSTFNNNSQTFPIDRRFYVDFSHDSVLTSVVAALNLEEFNKPLPVNQPDPKRKFRSSTIVPYAARMVFEEISCNSTSSTTTHPKRENDVRWFGSGKKKVDPNGNGNQQKIEDDGRDHFVRLLINEAIIDLHQLKGCQSRPDGMCDRKEFIQALKGRNEWAQWDKCFD